MKLARIQKSDFDQILLELEEFWGDRHEYIQSLHHPIFFHEFGDTGFVLRDDARVVAYLLGFVLKEKGLAYIHLIGVRQNSRKQGAASKLYEHFYELAAAQDCNKVKAITTAKNQASIEFHKALGFELQGDPNDEGIPVVKDYRCPGEDRVVFIKKLK
jgi:GNAT superfamily N-acetyltransferase